MLKLQTSYELLSFASDVLLFFASDVQLQTPKKFKGLTEVQVQGEACVLRGSLLE